MNMKMTAETEVRCTDSDTVRTDRSSWSCHSSSVSESTTIAGHLLGLDWIGLSSVLRPCQHSRPIGYMGDGFYRSKDPTNSIKVLKEHTVHRQIKHTIIKR